MSLRSRFAPAAGVLAICFMPLSAMADDLAALLPENTDFFAQMRSVSKLVITKDNPLITKLRTGEFGKALNLLIDKLDGDGAEKYREIIKEEAGLTVEELLAKFTGGLATGASVEFDKLVVDGFTEKNPPGILVVADFAGDEALFGKMFTALDEIDEAVTKEQKEKAKADPSADEEKEDAEDEDDEDGGDDDSKEKSKPLAEWPEQYEESTTDVEGANLHEWVLKDPAKTNGPKLSWAVAGGRVFLGIGNADTKEAVRRQIKKSDEGSLAATPNYKSIEDAAGEWDVLVGANLEATLAEVQEGLRLRMEKGKLDLGVPINPLQAWAGAGIDELKTAFMAWDLQGSVLDIHTSLTYGQKPAFLKIYAANGPGEMPLFAPADTQDVSWGTLDWGKTFDGIKELATAISPMAAGAIDVGLNTAKTKIGVDVRKDLLSQMGDNLWSMSAVVPPDKDAKPKKAKADDDDDSDDPLAGFASQSQVLGIAMRDVKAFELSLKSIMNTLAPGQGLFEDRDYMGNTIHQIKGLPATMPISWLIKNDTLIISVGLPDLLDKILAGMDKKPATPLLEQDFVKEAFSKLPDGHVSASYNDAGRMLESVLAGLKSGIPDSTPGGLPEFLASLPDQLNIPFFVVSRSYLSDKSADARIRVSAKP